MCVSSSLLAIEHVRQLRVLPCVKDASLTRTYSFLPASWAGNTHEETDFLPIGDQEEKEERCLNCRTDSLETVRVLMAKYLWTKVSRQGDWIASKGQRELA